MWQRVQPDVSFVAFSLGRFQEVAAKIGIDLKDVGLPTFQFTGVGEQGPADHDRGRSSATPTPAGPCGSAAGRPHPRGLGDRPGRRPRRPGATSPTASGATSSSPRSTATTGCCATTSRRRRRSSASPCPCGETTIPRRSGAAGSRTSSTVPGQVLPGQRGRAGAAHGRGGHEADARVRRREADRRRRAAARARRARRGRRRRGPRRAVACRVEGGFGPIARRGWSTRRQHRRRRDGADRGARVTLVDRCRASARVRHSFHTAIGAGETSFQQGAVSSARGRRR